MATLLTHSTQAAAPCRVRVVARGIGKEFVHGAYFTALAGLGVFCEELLLLQYPPATPLLALAFLLPLVVYNVDHLRGLESDLRTNPERATHLVRGASTRRAIVAVQLLAFLSTCGLVPTRVGIVSLVLLGLGLAYPKRLTATIPAFKSFYVAGSLGSLGALAIVWYPKRFDALGVIAALSFVFLRLFLNVVFSDLKDLESDEAEGLRTVPVMFGVRRTVTFLYVLNVVAYVPLAVGLFAGALPSEAAVLIALVPYTAWYLRESQSPSRGGGRVGVANIITHMMSEGEFIIGPALMLGGAAVGRLLQ